MIVFFFFFFFNDTATTEIYTLSLHDALPISAGADHVAEAVSDARTAYPSIAAFRKGGTSLLAMTSDRKSTRLNSSHANISYAVFCLKKKKKKYMYSTFSSVLSLNCHYLDSVQ